ncbi:hypothetical protein [Prosthecobacter sp.]|uniref:hypothetical protein n=1 Tax=Prosthecobacter sp. TaxID=1965333 RepID=UPI002ABBA249|nr:hypothetical protein [Prosthecobacter sp.]MDZ4405045.1 hypothetical protein [Prosthecobacter sp.]
MSFDLTKILDSKRAFRRDLAARSIGEKLRMLDAMRERELSLRGPRLSSSAVVQEEATAFHVTSR